MPWSSIKAIMVVIAREAKTSPVREPGLVLKGGTGRDHGVSGIMKPNSTGKNMRDLGSLTSADGKTMANSDGKPSTMQPVARLVVPGTQDHARRRALDLVTGPEAAFGGCV